MFVIFATVCPVPTERAVLDDTDERRENFDSILRPLDERLRYVARSFDPAFGHPKTLDAFLRNAAEHLQGEELAARTAKHLAADRRSAHQRNDAQIDADR